MKNKLFGIVILGVGIVLAGCGSQKQEQNQMPEQENTQQQSSVISSINKDAMDLGKKMKCEYSVDENGNAVKAASYVEGKNSNQPYHTAVPLITRFLTEKQLTYGRKGKQRA